MVCVGERGHCTCGLDGQLLRRRARDGRQDLRRGRLQLLLTAAQRRVRAAAPATAGKLVLKHSRTESWPQHTLTMRT